MLPWVLLLFWPLTGVADEPLRTWTSVSGKTVEASYEATKQGRVLLKTADGWAMSVPIDSLSPRDQGYLEALGAQPAAMPDDAAPDTPSSAEADASVPDEPTESEDIPQPAELPELGDGKDIPRKTFTLGDKNVKGYLVYRFKNGLTAVVFSGGHQAVDFYHPQLGRTYHMTLGPHDHTQLVVDDVALRPPHVRIRYTGMGWDFTEQRMTREEMRTTPRIEVGKGEIQMTFKPDGMDYRSLWKASVDNAPVNWVHFHVPEVGYGRTFRGGKEAFHAAFADTGLHVVPMAAPKKTLDITIGESVQKIFVEARTKYSWAHTPPGYSKVDLVNRAGTDHFGWLSTDEDNYLQVDTYHNEPMERRMWVAHKHITSKRRFNYIPDLETNATHIRMKDGIVLTLTGGIVFNAP
ncbi:MAG: hypothetical protein ACI9TH_004713 [Kiritimatiellia bacterium]|jgi:hypothetical protein